MKRSDIDDETVCRAVRRWREEFDELGVMADGVLEQETGAPIEVIFEALERAERRGLIECGVSLRGSWLTAAGRALLERADAEKRIPA